MRRSVFILLGAVFVAGAIFAGAFYMSRQVCVMEMSNPADDLGWLREEFKLTDAQMARIRELHEGYLPKCGDMCARIAAQKERLAGEMSGATNLSAEAEQDLLELGRLRAQCQTQMLRHFVDVSQAMPPEQGRRYLAEMQRLTLGFHEQIEQSMSDPSVHEHHQH
jgi:hypothetical protein